jgi:conjugative relaxase-like TrwC/TraI family protein
VALARNIGARHAATYYESDDYYTRDASPSEWHGEGARALGLSGPVDRATFATLVEGRLPDGSTLHRGGGARRGGTDFEFSAPKSFSIQALVNGDARLIEVHRSAVASARQRIEATVATRVTEHGKKRLEFTGSALIAQFEHRTSRAADPDLHSHVVVLNLTRRADGQWRSIENVEMFREQRLMYEIYLSELALGARTLGYEISSGKHGNPELSHITREQIEHFSRRSRGVEAALQSEGLTRESSTAAAKRTAALSTRSAKKEYDHASLRAEWIERGRAVKLAEYQSGAEPQRIALTKDGSVRAAIDFAVEHLSEREAAFSRRDVLIAALRATRGVATSGAIGAELDRQIRLGRLVSDGSGLWLTTDKGLRIETRLLAIERAGRDAVNPISLAPYPEGRAGLLLNAGQRSVVELILTTRNRVVGVNGLAGTGKTTALSVAKALAEREGFEFVGLAPSHSAVRALEKSGIRSETVQRWLMRRDVESKLTPYSIVVLDEAGLTGTSKLRAVLARVERTGARAVLVGDIHQYESVEAGRGFAQLQERGMHTAVLLEMIRQREPGLAEAARRSLHEPEKALRLLPIIEVKDSTARHARIASEFAALVPEAQEQTLLLTGSHQARRDINLHVRAALGLTGSGEHIRIFRALDRTVAERTRLETYRPGLALRFEKAYRSLGIRRGDIVPIERVSAEAIMVRLSDGRPRTVLPRKLSAKGWSVGTIEELELSKGDRIRFTGTDPTMDYRNGERGVVEELSADAFAIRRPDGSTLSLPRSRAASLDYSYAVTGHSAQGLDASRVVMEKDSHSRTTDRRSFYTDLTRARDVAAVVTDSTPKLAQRARMDHLKSGALDVVPSEASERQSTREYAGE